MFTPLNAGYSMVFRICACVMMFCAGLLATGGELTFARLSVILIASFSIFNPLEVMGQMTTLIRMLDSTLDRFNCCKCDKCKKDIAALALNRLKPRYVVMKEGEQEKRRKAELENGSEVTGALVQAILVVKKAPWH